LSNNQTKPPEAVAAGDHSPSRTETSSALEPTGSRSILVVETERLSTMRKVIKKTVSAEEPNNFSITVLCNNQRKKFYLSMPQVEKTLAYPAEGITAKIVTAVRLIFHAKKYDLAVAVLNGQRHFGKSKILYWVMRARKRMIFDGRLKSFFLNSGNFSRLFSRQRKTINPFLRIDVLLFETDNIEIVQEVIRVTRSERVIPNARITVFCRNSSADLLKLNPLVKNTISYKDHSITSWLAKASRTVTNRNTVIAGVLNGRKRFFFSKLLFCFCRNRHRLVFNGSLDCCFWNHHTYGQIIVQGLKAGVNSPFADNPRKVLILETAGLETMKKLISTAAEPKVNPNARITLFCNENRRETFSAIPEIEKIITYSDTSPWRKFRTSLRIIFSYPDAVVARFSGGKDFMPLKTLFWLVRTPNRIIFNKTLDCYYLNQKTAGLFFFGGNSSLYDNFLVSALRKIAKVFLFLPRFAYLLSWRGIKVLKFRILDRNAG
jgi:ADP-heptose:LPS heptosyltransferase